MPRLILGISGARGIVGDGLDAGIVTRLAGTFGALVGPGAIVLGRDSRPSGVHLARAAEAGLRGVGCDVVDVGLVPTPTVQVAVEALGAAGGLVVSASHNPPQWNALKFVGTDGRFLDPAAARELERRFETSDPPWSPHAHLGGVSAHAGAVDLHIERILRAIPPADLDAIRGARPLVVVDAVHGAGGVLLVPLLERLGASVHPVDCEPDGALPEDPEPRAEVLEGLRETVVRTGAQLGVRADPDGDRLGLVTPGGEAVGEEWTLPLTAWQRLERGPGPLVTNLSSSERLEWVASRFGAAVHRTPVGEAHVVAGIVRHRAVLGGEGNGGVIDPAVHLGRDAGVALARLLVLEATRAGGLGSLAATFPPLFMVKVKIPAPDDYRGLQGRLSKALESPSETTDGLRWRFRDGWVHLRPSGTEPVLRVVAEAPSREGAEALVQMVRRAGGV